MRNKIVAGNWKMNLNAGEAEQLVISLQQLMTEDSWDEAVTVIIAPSYVHLTKILDSTKSKKMYVAAQNCYHNDKGAYTGEVSAAMLASYGVPYCIVGHSERRMYFAEDAATIAGKINLLLQYHITPIFCCGEPLSVRDSHQEMDFVKSQMEGSLFHLSGEAIQKIVIAYEPVWAIGTGLTATPQQAQDMHVFIRNCIADRYGVAIAQEISILYGGSCNTHNAAELFACSDIDGGLIGGASLNAIDFFTIIQSFHG
jgi:triosephosphate isomerase